MPNYLSNDGYLRQRALACARFLMEYNAQTRGNMQESLSRMSFIHDPLFEEILRMSAEMRKSLNRSVEMRKLLKISACRNYLFGLPTDFLGSQFRHCDVEGRLTHIVNKKFQFTKCYRKECAKEYELILYSTSDFSLFWVTPGEEVPVVIPKNVIPIVAGYLADGRKAFLPLLSEELVTESNSLEGRRPNGEDGRVSKSNYHAPTKIKLLCLRYPPDKYPRLFGPNDFMRGEGAGIDATGPYSWRFTRNLPHLETEESDKYSETEEPDEYIESEESDEYTETEESDEYD